MTDPDTEDGYPIPATEIRVEEEIRNSRFITTLAPADTGEAARAMIERVRAEFPDATTIAGPSLWARRGALSTPGRVTTGSREAPRGGPCSPCYSTPARAIWPRW